MTRLRRCDYAQATLVRQSSHGVVIEKNHPRRNVLGDGVVLFSIQTD